jgi:oligo-1,6-glucosidase
MAAGRRMIRSSVLATALVSSSLLFGSFAAPAKESRPQQSATTQPATPKLINGYEPKWWKEAVIYQIYPRSFQDSNGDGVGDLKGITSHLDYLQKLGVNVIWLSPHFDSPNADNGYDIRDYRKVMAEFGTMDDFDAMLAGIKQRHMRLIIDLVANHTSDEHKWFVESSKSKDNPYRDFYIWRPGKVGPDGKMQPPNNYPSAFSGSAWQYDPATKEYYLHYFAVKQPDLNWDNPKVRQEVFSLMRFWLDKGVDGFRMDVIPFISKQPGLPDLTAQQMKNAAVVYASGPHLQEYLQQMNREVLSKYDDMSVGEAAGITLEQTPSLVDDRRHELNEIFNFDAVRVNREGRRYVSWTLPQLKAIYTRHAEVLTKHDWDTVFLSNHDNPRLVSSFGDDSAAFRVPSAKLLETMLLTLRGTPYIYQGDELGMTNYPFKTINDFNDIEAHNGYKDEVQSRHILTEEAYIENLKHMGRDNSRTPMQWDGTANAGFTSGPKPWLAVNPNYKTVNAAQEVADPNSIYNYTARLIALHAKTPAFVYGDYKDLDPQHPHIFVYTRTLNNEQYLVVHNFSAESIAYTLPGGLTAGKLLMDNYSGDESSATSLHLKGWESRIYKQH